MWEPVSRRGDREGEVPYPPRAMRVGTFTFRAGSRDLSPALTFGSPKFDTVHFQLATANVLID